MHIRPHGAVGSPQRVYDICMGGRMGGWGVSGTGGEGRGGEGRGGEGRGGGWGRVERGCLLFVGVCWLCVCVGVGVGVCVCVGVGVCWWCVGGVCVWTSHVIPYLTQENECPPGRAGVRP